MAPSVPLPVSAKLGWNKVVNRENGERGARDRHNIKMAFCVDRNDGKTKSFGQGFFCPGLSVTEENGWMEILLSNIGLVGFH